MTFSPLASRQLITNKHGNRNGQSVQRLIVHHTAGGSNEGNLNVLSVTDAQESATYCLFTTGQLVGIVPEEFRPWTTGTSIDESSVTCETVNTTGPPDWKVGDVQLNMLASLAADLGHRYNWGHIDRNRVMGHRQFKNTECPGPYLYPRLDWVAARAQEIFSGGGGGGGGGSKPAVPSGSPLLRWKPTMSIGSAVRDLQLALNYAAGVGLDPDGKYGENTSGAVWNLQNLFKIWKDGIYGPDSARVLAYAVAMK